LVLLALVFSPLQESVCCCVFIYFHPGHFGVFSREDIIFSAGCSILRALIID